MAFWIQISTIFSAGILENAMQKGQLLVVKRRGQNRWLFAAVSVKVQWGKLPYTDVLVPRGTRALVIIPKCHIVPPPLSGDKS